MILYTLFSTLRENSIRAGIFNNLWGLGIEQDIGLHQPARLHRLAESILWNRFLGSLKVEKFGL
jgi:hypothetical protein